MAWSDDMRCLYCDGKLPLYRKITSGQFCSAVHRKAYWQDQERLAVERLHQTHDSLRAYRPPEALDTILGKPAASEPVSAGKYYLDEEISELESQPKAAEIARSASNTGSVKFSGFLTEEKPALRAWHALLAAWDVEFAQWPMSSPSLPSSAAEFGQRTFETAPRLAMPRFLACGLAAQIRAGAEKANAIGFTLQPITKVPFAAAPETEELTGGFVAARQLAAAPVQELEPETPFAFAENLAALPKIDAQQESSEVRDGQAAPIETASREENTSDDASFASPAVSRLQPLPLTNAPRTLAARAGAAGDAQASDLLGYAQAMELKSSTGAPWKNLPIPAAGLALGLAPGSRYPIFGSAGAAIAKAHLEGTESTQALDLRSETSGPVKQPLKRSLELGLETAPGCRYEVHIQAGAIQPVMGPQRAAELSIVPAPAKALATQSLELSPNTAPRCEYPVHSQPGTIQTASDTQPHAARNAIQIVPLPDGLGRKERNPAAAKSLPLAFRPAPCAPPAVVDPVTTGIEHVYALNAPMNPVAKWEPIDGSDTPPLHQGFLAGWTQTLASAEERKHLWSHAADFLQHAPRDLKLLAIAIPILLGLALRPSLPKVRVTAPSSTDSISRNIENGFRQQFVNVRNTVAQRAGVSLNEDFRAGLDDWQTRGDLGAGWSFDGNGFVRPGTLALYRPSLNLTDYDMEFLGLIDKKALSWVVRAQDFDNYYVVKLVMVKSGPLPTIGITRYAVIDGKAQARVDTVAAINARPDELYRVTMNVHEDTFLLVLQGKVVDNWTDTRLKRGGIGFFAPRGEESRLRWVQVTHQYDMLGRLCAYLAPYNIPTTNGSW